MLTIESYLKKDMNKSIFLVILYGALTICSLHAQKSEPVFESLIKVYAESINKADTVLAATFWSKSPEVSFINPRSTEYGWEGVKNIYEMFGANFNKRDLRFSKLKVQQYKDVAWLTFQWVFDATFKKDDSPMQTKGRETQIWRKDGKSWKLVHIHYSGLPLNGEREGF